MTEALARAVEGCQAALIDMDGTLYDSMPLHSAAWQELCRCEGLSFEPGEFFMLEGATGAAVIDMLMLRSRGRHATDEEKHDLYHRKTLIFKSMTPPRAMPGALDMLQAFASRGIKRVLVTGSAQGSLLGRLDDDYPGMFLPDMRVTALDVTCGKPDPEPFIIGAQKAGADPSRCIVVENAPLGVQAGHASGAFTVAVATGPIPADTLADAGADLVFSSMTDFATTLHLVSRQLNI